MSFVCSGDEEGDEKEKRRPIVSLNHILHRSEDHWLTASQLVILLQNADQFQIENPTLIPFGTPGLFRVDNEWNRDRNDWLHSSLQRQRSYMGIRFLIKLSMGFPFEADKDIYVALFRSVIRRRPHPFIPVITTFAHYMNRNG
ncbi:hypothetical protein Bca101_041684 [Brassica carinata]